MSERIAMAGVTLERRTQEELSYDLKRLILHQLQGKRRKTHRRRVLDDVSVNIASGEKIGIIGANGSGKSTLLKVMCGILRPQTGRVRVDGRIAPLIELGAGFDANVPVADNIVYYGVFLGHPRAEMLHRSAAILDFAELHDHAHEPLKALSSGMSARLGFAIATEFHPDILVLDEVLSVGDERFRAKCRERMDRLWLEDCTIVLVSHELAFVREQCSRAIWMDAGRVRYDGDSNACVDAYLGSLEQPARLDLVRAERA